MKKRIREQGENKKERKRKYNCVEVIFNGHCTLLLASIEGLELCNIISYKWFLI